VTDIKYTCKGPRIFVADRRKELVRKLKDTEVSREIHGVKVKRVEWLSELEDLDTRIPDEDLGRKGCGFDLTSQIRSLPVTGESYEYLCPKCGNTGTVTPVYEDDLVNAKEGEA